MSSIHMLELPRRVVVGTDVLRMVGETCKAMGFSERALVFTGPITHEVASKHVVDSLRESGFNADLLIMEKSASGWMGEAERKIEETHPNLLIGVGGGRIIDAVKHASAVSKIQFVSVPTSASHDGIASPQVSAKNLGGAPSLRAYAPAAIFADIHVISSSPFRLTASGCGDIIAKFTATRDWLLAHNLKNEYYGDYAANLALMSAKLVAKNAGIIHDGSLEGIHVVVEALVSCGVAMSIAGSSRPCSGSEHLFSHALDMVASNHALHGEQCGVGTIMMAYLHKMNWKKIQGVLKRIGAPTNAAELNVKPEDVVEALMRAHEVRLDRYTILGEKGLNERAALKLAKSTGVI